MEYVVHIIHSPGVRWWACGHLFPGVELGSVVGGRWRGSEYGDMEKEVLQMGRMSLALPDQGIRIVVFLCSQYPQRLT